MVLTSEVPRQEDIRTASNRLTAALEWPMAALALAVIPALLLDDDGAAPRIHVIATGLNWAVWLGICGEFGLRLILAPDRRAFVRRSWLDLLIIVVSPPFWVPEYLQGARAVRALRLLRLLRPIAFLTIGLRFGKRALGHRRFHYVLAVAAAVTLLGALGLWTVERRTNEALTSFADAVWWAVTTTTTVGYGDIYPRTGEGRMIAVLLMLTGIGLIGIFTATIASFFMNETGESEADDLRRRLDRLEAKLDQLLVDRKR